MKKIFYASSVFYPSQYANRLQTLQTAEALGKKLGGNFVLGCNNISGVGEMYKHTFVNFYARRSPLLALKQLLYVRKQKCTVVYSREYTLIFLMMLYNRLFRLPTEFSLEVHEMYDSFRFRFVVRRCKNIFCITSGLCDDLKKEFNLSFTPTVLPDGVDVDAFSQKEEKRNIRKYLNLPDNAFIAAYVGSVGRYEWKGVDIFLKSFENIKSENVWYVVAGVRKEDIGVLRGQYHGKHVRFFGWLNRDDIARVMHSADVLILPNKKGNVISERYTSPLKLFEYMASGTPIIASDLGSIREILDETSAIFVPPNEPSALAEAIEGACSNQPGLLSLGRTAQELAKQYSWDMRADIILSKLSLL